MGLNSAPRLLIVSAFACAATAWAWGEHEPLASLEEGQVSVIEAAMDCGLCHRARVADLESSAHGALASACLDCHAGADGEHAETLGAQPAPHPDAYMPAAQNRLCVECHSPRSGSFQRQHQEVNWRQDPRCLSCHDFHGLTSAIHASSTIRSHGLLEKVPAPTVRAHDLDWRGQWLVGVRGLSGLEPSFETHQSLAPGLLLRKAEASTEWADNRSLALSLSGVGDPRASAQVHWADPTMGRGEFTWNRSEDVFQLESELHELESVRERFGLRWQVESGTLEGTEWGWERFKKSALGEGSRYRWVSNSFFEDVSIDRSETVDRLWVRDDATLGEWRLRWQPELTWWKDQDRRHFRIPNLAAGVDDAEDIRASGDAWLPVFRVHAAGPWSDQWQGDSEFIATYATRSYEVEGEVEGELSSGLPYTGTLDADGRLRALALRWEVGGLWQYQEDLGLDVRLRLRREQEQATIPFEEALDVPGASITELAETSSRLQGVDLEALGRWDLSSQSALDLGYGVRRESFSTQGSSGRPGNGDTGGLLLEFRSQISDALSLKLRSRAYSLSDPYTALTPEHRAKHDLDFTWTPSENTQIQAGWSQGRTRFSTAGDFAQMMRGHVFASWTQEDWRLHSGGIWRDYDTEISTVINSPLPQAWLAAFSGQSWAWHNSLSMQAKEDLVIEAALDVLEVLEDSSSEHVRAELGILHDFGDRTQLQARAFWWKFDGTQADEDDYRVTGFELLYGRHF